MVVPATDRLVIVENKCIAASGIPTGMGVMLPSGKLLRHVILRDPSANIAAAAAGGEEEQRLRQLVLQEKRRQEPPHPWVREKKLQKYHWARRRFGI